MREYIQIIFRLLLPLTGLFMVLSVLYYKQENDFNEAIKIGVLTGFLVALVITPFIAFFLFLMRRTKIPKPKMKKRVKSKETIQKNVSAETKVSKKSIFPKKKLVPTSSKIKKGSQKSISMGKQKIILLMDKALSLNVILYAITDQNIGTVTQEKENEQTTISIQTDTEQIKLIITALTRHTTEVTIISSDNSEDTKKIITYVKEKEFSFLQY